jgi:predicted nucleic acid-binding protein
LPKRTYLDSGVLIAAFKGAGEIGKRALEILDDRDRKLVVSDAVYLEVFPKPKFHKNEEEVKFYQELFRESEQKPWSLAALKDASDIATTYDISAMDAVHIAHAIEAQVDEFVTAEKSNKPMFKIKNICISSLRG